MNSVKWHYVDDDGGGVCVDAAKNKPQQISSRLFDLNQSFSWSSAAVKQAHNEGKHLFSVMNVFLQCLKWILQKKAAPQRERERHVTWLHHLSPLESVCLSAAPGSVTPPLCRLHLLSPLTTIPELIIVWERKPWLVGVIFGHCR